MRSNGRVVLAAAVAVMAALALILLRPGTGETPPLPAPAPSALPPKPAVPAGGKPAAEPVPPQAAGVRPGEPSKGAAPGGPAPAVLLTTEFSGTVLDGNRHTPIAGAKVVVVAWDASGRGEGAAPADAAPPLGSGTTDAAGRYRTGGILLGEGVTVRASAPGHRPGSESFRLREDTPPPGKVEMDLCLPGPGALRGSVRLPDGRPAEGATVYVFTAREEESRRIDPTRGSRHGLNLEGTAGPDGTYEVLGLALDMPYLAIAVMPDVGRSRPARDLLPTAGAPAVGVDFQILDAGMLRVRVLLHDGSPCSGAYVALDPGLSKPLSETEPGLYIARKESAGDHVVEVAKEDWIPVRMHVELPELGDTSLEVRLEKGAAVAGRVTDDAGRPLAGVRVFVERPPGTEGRLPPSAAGTWSDTEGRFRIEGLRPGLHLVDLPDTNGDGADDGLLVYAPEEDMKIVVARIGTVLLRLVVPPGVAPPEAVSARIEREPEGRTDGRVDLAGPRRLWYRKHFSWNDGRLAVEVAGGVHVRVLVDAPGFARLWRSAIAPVGGTVDLGEVPLDPGLDVEGRVVDGAGKAVEGATISFGGEHTSDHKDITTDGEGKFVVPHFPRGRAACTVSAGEFVPTTATLESPASGPVVVTLRRGARLTVRVLDAEGALAVGTRVRWTRPGGGVDYSDSEETGPRGTVELRLPAGRCALALLDEKWNPVADAAKEMELVEGGASTVELRLPRR